MDPGRAAGVRRARAAALPAAQRRPAAAARRARPADLRRARHDALQAPDLRGPRRAASRRSSIPSSRRTATRPRWRAGCAAALLELRQALRAGVLLDVAPQPAHVLRVAGRDVARARARASRGASACPGCPRSAATCRRARPRRCCTRPCGSCASRRGCLPSSSGDRSAPFMCARRVVAERRQHRRPDVVVRGPVAAGLALGLAVRVADRERHVAQLRVDLGVALAHPAVLAQQHAVVAGQHHQRVVEQAEVGQPVEEVARARCRPSSPRPRTAARIRRSSDCDRPSGAYLAAGVGNGWIGSTPLASGEPYMSLMRCGTSQGSWASNESITSANGWRVRAHSTQPIASVNTRGERYSSSAAVARVGLQVGPHARLGARPAQRGRHVLVELVLRGPRPSACAAAAPGRPPARRGRARCGSACAPAAAGAGCR